ncbi:type II secretion system protein [Actinotalea fermentans]|uniref:Prepilin-type N-terminal cleavage/methylation domain-containing protein n=1 Tax=Actinotalea fermentans TaxID=43671 RepID=A0A511YUI2_9CELL|nr:type II secretion system protein [Actinotalea fermentans]KGM17040.1 hypothetical protein N867_10890 [Actinotalea fermentans ATCC 43279 = JCM 9966 = DSM 3133]GEN78851.1 hypothetical protein AFE02nite_05850 [Actinotalea fermentans]
MRRDDDRRDAGMTLVELLTAMIVFGIAMTMIMTAVMLVMRSRDEVLQSANAVAEVREALQTIDRQVRSGNVLFNPGAETIPSTCTGNATTRTGTCMRVYTQADGVPRCYQWQVVDNGPGESYLRSRSWLPGGASTEWTTVATDLTLTGAPFKLEGADTAYDERLVRVAIYARDARTGRDVKIDSALTGRNTTYGFDAGQCTPVPAPVGG